MTHEFLFVLWSAARAHEREIAAAFFFDMAIREADFMLDRAFGACIWPWALTGVTLTFAAVTVRYAKTVYHGLRAMRRSRRFRSLPAALH